jgi:hypothetical protein
MHYDERPRCLIHVTRKHLARIFKLKARPHELTNDDIRIMVNEYIEDWKMEQFIANSRGNDHERRGDNERRAVQRILQSSEKSYDEETEAVILLGN